MASQQPASSSSAAPAAAAPIAAVPIYGSSYVVASGAPIYSSYAPAYGSYYPAPVVAAPVTSASGVRGRNVDDLKASGEFIGPGPDYMYTEEVYEGPKRDYVESYGRDEAKDEYYDRVLKERFSSILTIVPKKPAPAPAPVPRELPAPRPNANTHLYIAPEGQTRAEGQTISAAGWYVDTDYKNVTYKWFSNGTLVGTNQSLYIAPAFVGQRLKVEATHRWLDVPITQDAYTDVPVPAAPAPPKIGPLADVILIGENDHNAPIRTEYKWNNNAGTAVNQWRRSAVSASDFATAKPIPNATGASYLPTVDDLHAYLSVRATQVDEAGNAVGEPLDKAVPAHYLDINKALERSLNEDFKHQKAGYQVADAATGAPVFINLDRNGITAFSGTQASGQALGMSAWTPSVQADLSYDNYHTFFLTLPTGTLNLRVATADSDRATSLARDKVVLAIRSFKGFHLQKSEQQLHRAASMYQKAGGSLSKAQKLEK